MNADPLVKLSAHYSECEQRCLKSLELDLAAKYGIISAVYDVGAGLVLALDQIRQSIECPDRNREDTGAR